MDSRLPTAPAPGPLRSPPLQPPPRLPPADNGAAPLPSELASPQKPSPMSALTVLQLPEPEPEPQLQPDRRRRRSIHGLALGRHLENKERELDMDLAEWLDHIVTSKPELERGHLAHMLQEPDSQVASVLAYAAGINRNPTVRALLTSRAFATGVSLGALVAMCRDDGEAMVDERVLSEIYHGGNLDDLGDLLRAGDPLPPATPPAGSARLREAEGFQQEGEMQTARAPNEPQPYCFEAHVGHDSDSGEEDPSFQEWSRSVDDLAETLRTRLYKQRIAAAEFIRQCDVNRDGDVSASELHRKYNEVVVADPDNPREAELTLGEARLVLQEIAANPAAKTCTTEEMHHFLMQAEDPSCFWHNLVLRPGTEYRVSKQHENTYDSAPPLPPSIAGAEPGTIAGSESSAAVPSMSASMAAPLGAPAEELRRTRASQRRTTTQPSIFAFSDHAIQLGRMELQHGRLKSQSRSTISYTSLGRDQPVTVWIDEIDEHSWNRKSGRRKTTRRHNVGFELRNDEGVLLRFRVEELDASPSAEDWATGLNTLGRRARRYLELEKRAMDSKGREIAAGGWELVKAYRMEEQAAEWPEKWDIDLESGGWKTKAESGSGPPRPKVTRAPFEESLRVMDADSRAKFDMLSKELSSLRAQRKKRQMIDDPKLKSQVGMMKQGAVRGRRRRKEERLVKLLMSHFEELISARLATHVEQTPHLPLEDTVAELEVTVRALAAEAFPDLSTKLLAPAVRKALVVAQEAAAINNPKDAMGGVGRCRVRALADYTPEPSFGPRYTYLMQGEELMVTDISDSQWWEGYREISIDGELDWEEAANRAFFPRAFTEVIWCECLFVGAERLGITFAAAPNSRGHTCFTVHQIDQVACKAHAAKLKVGTALDTINGTPSLGMTKSEMLKAIRVRPLLLRFVCKLASAPSPSAIMVQQCHAFQCSKHVLSVALGCLVPCITAVAIAPDALPLPLPLSSLSSLPVFICAAPSALCIASTMSSTQVLSGQQRFSMTTTAASAM